MSKVINVKVAYLRPEYQSLQEWIDASPDHVYIGRDMSFYVQGAKGSKWRNPFSVKRYGREKCLEKYREYVMRTPELRESIYELKGKVLGCWCSPDSCHGDILVELIRELPDE